MEFDICRISGMGRNSDIRRRDGILRQRVSRRRLRVRPKKGVFHILRFFVTREHAYLSSDRSTLPSAPSSSNVFVIFFSPFLSLENLTMTRTRDGRRVSRNSIERGHVKRKSRSNTQIFFLLFICLFFTFITQSLIYIIKLVYFRFM